MGTPNDPTSTSLQRRIRADVQLTPQILDSEGKITPLPDRPNILITSALPYVNNAPHLGNIIGSTLSADVFARYSRTSPIISQVLFICGTDEYGTTTETKALEEGMSPKDLCDKYHQIHKDSYQWFDIEFDHFGRTTTPKQTEICQEIFTALYDNGHLTEHEMEQVYCEKDSRFLADRFVEGTCPKCGAGGARGDQCDTCCQTLDAIDLIDKKCKICSSTPISKKSKHLFLNLPKLQSKIENWYNSAKEGHHWSANGKAFTEAWLRDGLRERCLTRDLKWGVPVPIKGWEDKVMYVWFDAPIGYPSITANYTNDWKKWWKNPKEVTLYQFMGKDNVPFHTILFPSYLMGTNQEWTMLNHISTTEYLQYENVKFSKSNNVGVFGQNARETKVPSEVWRYYLISTRPETNDAQFTWTDFISKANSELLNNLGNFVNRIVKFCNARFRSTVPNPSSFPISGPLNESQSPSKEDSSSSDLNIVPRNYFDEEDQEFVGDINNLLTQYIESMESLKLRNALAIVMAISARGNQYLQENKIDYSLLLASPRRCAQIVLVSLNLVYLLSILVHPFMPTTCDLILKQLNAPMRRLVREFGIDLLPGHVIGDAIYLFRKIDSDRAAFWRKQYGGNKQTMDGGSSTNQKSGGVESNKSKKKAAHASKSAAKNSNGNFIGPKPAEMIDIEQRIISQGDLVRQIKAGSTDGDVNSEVSKLLQLKKDLSTLIEKLSKSSIDSK